MSHTSMNPTNQYYCDVCDYFARDAYNMRKHVDTRKHIQMCIVAGKTSEETVVIPTSTKEKEKDFECEECGSLYAYRQSLWRHKQKMHQ